MVVSNISDHASNHYAKPSFKPSSLISSAWPANVYKEYQVETFWYNGSCFTCLSIVVSPFPLSPTHPSPHNLIHHRNPFPTRLHFEPLPMLLPAALTKPLHPLVTQLNMDKPLHAMRVRDLPRGQGRCEWRTLYL
ncbi:MAG: hypothetical protein FRX48_04194 [Lasallia pustulata]|uniref:Uncharacterized protein n=1 Tax=Lasallia pustulata TaxID=136370 RepID=A0A5M8PTW0_9LECA|nr:MAG: hypothetical protein FRX48_04194 [Lasallia pustulata]